VAIQDEKWAVVEGYEKMVASHSGDGPVVARAYGDEETLPDRVRAIAALPDLVRALQVLTHAGIALRKAGVLK
jgi:hypothetical protein